MRKCFCLLAVALMLGSAAFAAPADALKAAGFQGGLIVRLDCRGADELAALADGPGRLVHGLVKDASNIQSIRQELVKEGLGGIATVAVWEPGVLPYVDRSVNLIIADSVAAVPKAEAIRVLAPFGRVVVKKDDKWRVVATVPWPKTIDSWTHYMHAPDNNVVANDKEIDMPKHMQWIGGPRWSRHHDHLASVNAMVTERGKLFYIIDEGSVASILMPPDWKLVCRDAFNGIVLWERPIERWWPHLFPLKAGPANLPRRLVAVGDEVYAPQTVFKEVAAYNAADGEILRTYEGSGGAEEILVVGDTMLVLTNPTQPGADPKVGSFGPEVEKNTKIYAGNRPSRSPITDHFWVHIKSKLWLESDRTIHAYNVKSGKKLWDYKSRVAPLTLGSDGSKIYFHDSERIIAVDLKSGRKVFETEPVPITHEFMMSFFGATLVIHDGVVLFAGGEKMHQAWAGWGLGEKQGQDTMHAFDAKTGKKLWDAPHPYGGYQSPEDLIVAQGLVWVADTANGRHEGVWLGYNLRTGKVEKEIPPTVKTKWFHHRCYRAKATERFLLPSRNGIEYIDLENKEWKINHWVRSACLYGIMPANGFIYNAPHDCACHPMAKLYGFNALAPEIPSRAMLKNPKHPLEKGPAYGKVMAVGIRTTDWPVYRGHNNRAGSAAKTIGPKLKREWKIKLNGKITQPVVQGDLMVVSAVTENTVHALSASTGREKWRYVAGGRVDSVPTLAEGYCVFGSADGYVTCLRASDGKLVWRFRAAPIDRRIFSFGQLESVWRVYGTVLVNNGEVIFTAGRSMYLEGGALFFRLDLKTGRLNHKKVMTMMEDGKELQAGGGLDTPPALTDVMSLHNDKLYIRQLCVDNDGNRSKGDYHLFAPYGFTDDEWFHRGYWTYGNLYSGGHGGYPKGHKVSPSGRMVVFDDQNVYAYGRERQYLHWTTELEYYLFAATRQDKWTPPPASAKKDEPEQSKKKKRKRKKGSSGAGYNIEKEIKWSTKVPVAVRAMLKTGDVLYLAGPPDVMDEDEIFQVIHRPETDPVVKEQNASYFGELGSILYAVDAKTGKKLLSMEIDEVPAFDGLITANGKLYMSTTEGELICFTPDK